MRKKPAASVAALAPVALAVAALVGSGLAQAEDTTLSTVEVRAQQAKDMPTEISEGYTPAGITVGSKLPATLKETPHSVSVITRQQIEDQNLTSLDQIMAQTPGVSVDLSGTGVIPAFYSRGYPVEYFQYDGLPVQTGGAS